MVIEAINCGRGQDKGEESQVPGISAPLNFVPQALHFPHPSLSPGSRVGESVRGASNELCLVFYVLIWVLDYLGRVDFVKIPRICVFSALKFSA